MKDKEKNIKDLSIVHTLETEPKTEPDMDHRLALMELKRKQEAELLALSRQVNEKMLSDDEILDICKVMFYDAMYKKFGKYDIENNTFGNNIDFKYFDRREGGMSSEIMKLGCFVIPPLSYLEADADYLSFGLVIKLPKKAFGDGFFGLAVRVGESSSGERSLYFNVGKDPRRVPVSKHPIIWYYSDNEDKCPHSTPLSRERLEFEIQGILKKYVIDYDIINDVY